MFSDPHIGNTNKSETTEDMLKRLRNYHDEFGPDPAQDDSFHGIHPNDQGERTNKKLVVQPFYHRGRNGKMRPY
ncbi:hypothetical protein D3C81_334860 [compost metagenome]